MLDAKQRSLFLLLLATTICTCMGGAVCEAEDPGRLTDVYKRWTSVFREYTVQFSCTYLAEELLDSWQKNEENPEVIGRIATLRRTLKDKKYNVYLIAVTTRGDRGVSLFPISKTVRLNITEKSPHDIYPIAYSKNLDNPLFGFATHYGVVVFQRPEDEFAFQALVVDVEHQYRDVFLGKDRIRSKASQMQFAYLPHGVPVASRPGNVNAADALNFLKTLIDVALALVK